MADYAFLYSMFIAPKAGADSAKLYTSPSFGCKNWLSISPMPPNIFTFEGHDREIGNQGEMDWEHSGLGKTEVTP